MDEEETQAEAATDEATPQLLRRIKNSVKSSPMAVEYRELLRKQIIPAAKRGSEGHNLIRMWLRYFGRVHVFRKLKRRIAAKHPDWSDEVVEDHVFREYFDYRGVMEERHQFYMWRDLFAMFRDDCPETPAEVLEQANSIRPQGAPKKAEREAAQSAFDVEAAFNALPADAPPDQRLHWVQSHPRLFRLRQNPPADDAPPDTTLSVDDINNPHIGTAPSKAAVTMLQEALANPKDFWRAMLSEQKKTTTKTAAHSVDDFGEASDEYMLQKIENNG
jgi:hypothetical protein